ncbi:MAG: hypothetical protein OEZ25_04860, partial [Candidatus Bathyarchaeota archaeon]|nr:hypothetical protein [Candidatus Bathyarchaeota archaeon]
AFRVAFVVTFLLSVMAVSIYAFSVFRPFSSWLVLVLLSVYFASGKDRTKLPAGFRGKYWWLPLALATLAMAFSSYHNYTLNQIGSLVFSATLCLISVGFLVYYYTRMETTTKDSKGRKNCCLKRYSG